MDFGHLISQAYRITIKNRVLWIFGIIAAFFGSGPQFFNFPPSMNFNFTGAGAMNESSSMPDFGFISYIKPEAWLLLLILIFLIIFGIVLVVVYFQTWSYGALVSQTLNIIAGKPASFKAGKKSGEKFFWRVLGFRILVGLILIPAILVLAIPPLLFFIAGMEVLAIAFAVIDVVILIFGLFIYAIVAGIASEFGLRLMIERDLAVVDSIKQGLHLFRYNLGKSLLVWLVNVALGFVVVFPFIFISLFFFIFGFVVFLLNPWLVIIPIVIFMTVLAFLGGLWNVFLFSYWSLAFNEIKKGGAIDAARTNSTASSAGPSPG